MPPNIVSSSHELEFKSFRDCNGDHPSQTLVFHNDSFSWWIKVEIAWSLPESIRKLGYFKRQFTFQEFIQAIDFGELELMDDTVTQANNLLSIADRIFFQVEEDPGRTVYPLLDQSQDLHAFEACYLKDEKVIAPTVSTVNFKQKRLAYKKINRPIYVPGDTEHILNEIIALAKFRGQPNIAQLIGIVISDNPYKTGPATIPSPVITGFLLEYYPEGSLDQVLAEDNDQDDSLLRRWALQIGGALEMLHMQRRTHLDIKPSNVVLDSSKNAILIDISGTGGYGWEWLALEMQKTIEQNIATPPAGTSFDKRVATDCWAYEKLLSTMATKLGTSSLDKRLQSIGDDLTRTDPKARISITHALERLRGQKEEY
ncbi:putative serine-threonine protein kinase [Aspergillus steynii IBT 23096]|uniref:Putative serine-threonine protein kinase n=1 Tax=Aspergillus steynii IBT 23096 TaxID=1392250 RepID=A0A2I2G644_9EURO|nr:putative serine-threonine protein kinase [Aspergillus steynii IBT 23096]PLB48323.1 putative serine-threonine protein kinase [Aspergillus steynii IBT 23096]